MVKATTPTPIVRTPYWPAALVEALGRLTQPLSAEERNERRSTAWPILRTVLAGYVRHHAGQLGPISDETVEDIAAEKALDLLLRCESRAWNPSGWSGPQLKGFLFRVARNGVVDQLRASGPRRQPTGNPEEAHAGSPASGAAGAESPSSAVESAEYAGHLLTAVRSLKPRARIVWFLRACFEWSSRRIAAHPDVRMPASHVDVELQRARGRIRRRMLSAGFDKREMPAGTFAALWDAGHLHGAIPAVEDPTGDPP